MPWFTPEYLEARLREQEHERRLAEFETRLMKTPSRPTLLELLRHIAHTLLKRH
jgi:demethoxyubiquinone hydroxylase (CLK1/Coq7/Cat5 family)